MRKTWKVAILSALSGALLTGIAGTAAADSHVRFSIGLGVPAPVVYSPYYAAPAYYPAPQAVYAPAAPVYYAPPVVYSNPVRVVYGSRPYWRGHGHRHWR